MENGTVLTLLEPDKVIKGFLDNYIQKNEAVYSYWEPRTRSLFQKKFSKYGNTYSKWEIIATKVVKGIFFYFVRLFKCRGESDKKMFCVAKELSGCYVLYPVNCLDHLIDISELEVVEMNWAKVHASGDICKLYDTEAIREKFARQNILIESSGLKSFVKGQYNVFWLSDGDSLKHIAKRTMFVEPKSGNIYIFLDTIDDYKLFHEIIHNLFWGALETWPTLLFREGSAEAFFPNEYYEGRTFSSSSINKMIETDRFDSSIGESCAIHLGFFCRFLIHEYGIEKFIEAYKKDDLSGKDVLENVYGMDYKMLICQFDLWQKRIANGE